MKYRTKVEFTTKGKTYEPGSILPDDISASDLAFLKMKKFVIPVDAAAVLRSRSRKKRTATTETREISPDSTKCSPES